jgi:hypothetical protein
MKSSEKADFSFKGRRKREKGEVEKEANVR